MAKQKKKHKKKSKARGIMDRSDIPYAQRLNLQHDCNISANRNHAAKIAMFCLSAAMHEEEGIGYKRLIRYSLRFKEVVDDFYKDPELEMAHAKRRMEQMGMPISGELYAIKDPNKTDRALEIANHRIQAVQISLICGAIAMNDEFGFAQERQLRITKKSNEYSARYAKEGEKFLLEKMEKIGFQVENGEVIGYMDDDGKIITPKQWRELANLNATLMEEEKCTK
jgi:hypothetical protein